MDNNNQPKDKELQEYIKKLVIARINALSKDLEISVDSGNECSPPKLHIV